MKVQRDNDSEKTKVNSFWLNEFAYDLHKNAESVDFLKDYLNKNKKKKVFNSIEEKLADIKERIGFELAVKVDNELEKISSDNVTASEDKKNKSCGCNDCGCKVSTASKKSEKDIAIMSNILRYIEDMIKHEGKDLDANTILFRCRNEDNLKYSFLESKIDKDKLTNYINSLLKDVSEPDFSYTPLEFSGESDNKVADYYRHAEPPTS